MKLSVLTTETLHHVYFVREIALHFPMARVYCETEVLRAPFKTAHPFEQKRENHERLVWFDGKPSRLADFAEVEFVPTMNEPSAVKSLAVLAPDVVVVFGTGRLRKPVMDVQPRLTLNLHGGNPEQYRELDTHLWAIYHKDFAGLVTVLHRVAPELDSGDIISSAAVPIHSNMALHELRGANSTVCVSLTLAALSEMQRRGEVPGRPQRSTGRYYSFMPDVLKEVCCRQFSAHTQKLQAKQSAAT